MMPQHDPLPSPPRPNAEFDRRRRQRAIVTGIALGALAVLFYFIAIAKMS
jgi:hypothetical protein